ncbi:MAG: polysaccharide biosynthesis/export family protein [Pseudomonadota bacterium]
MQFDSFRQTDGETSGLFGSPYAVDYYGLEPEPSTERPRICRAQNHAALASSLTHNSANPESWTLPFSPGDLVTVELSFDEAFSGDYIIDQAGRVLLPYIRPIVIAGKTAEAAARAIEAALVSEGMLLPGAIRISVRVKHYAPIQVAISGAIYEPGKVVINKRSAETEIQERTAAVGDHSELRSLTAAIRAASGVRPDADLNKIVVIRGGWQHVVNLSGALSGNSVTDFPLMAGDTVHVPSLGCFQPELMRPSQITMRGFRVFMSNLIVPAADNSSGAVGRYSTNLPYGTRLLQAAVSANCVGGIQSTNASRTIVLASTNPLTGKVEVMERSVEALLRTPNQEIANPFLMPNDAVACYDSAVTNLRDIARTVADLISPLKRL